MRHRNHLFTYGSISLKTKIYWYYTFSSERHYFHINETKIIIYHLYSHHPLCRIPEARRCGAGDGIWGAVDGLGGAVDGLGGAVDA